MSKIISNPKTYTGTELTTTFFRPILQGENAVELGIRVMYNMPVPTTLNFWKRTPDALKPFTKGWGATADTERFQKTINLSKVKAEMSYGAADYFSMVYEQIVGNAEVNLEDLSGTELEVAETELFRNAITESIRATMWIGDTDRIGAYSTFDGLLKRILADTGAGEDDVQTVSMLSMNTAGNAEKLFKNIYAKSTPQLKNVKKEGQLAFFVTRDVYENYETSLLEGSSEASHTAKINGIEKLYYRGIEVIDMGVDNYIAEVGDLPTSVAILTDRRNLALAVNTADFAGSQIAMWYNPDELENRQRAIFMAGCDYLLPELIVVSSSDTASN